MTLCEAFKLANEVERELEERKQKCDMSEKVEVVVKIPKYYLTHPQDYTCLAECVRRGTLLPKGHSRLIEESEIDNCINGVLYSHESYSLETFLNIIHEQCLSTIEADKAESEENNEII